MRTFLHTSLVAAALGAASVLSHPHHGDGPPGRVRKTMGFGQQTKAVFRSSPDQIPQGFIRTWSSDPLELASNFVESILAEDGMAVEGSSFTRRQDSYTDDNTGVTHAYFRQVINGIEVADGDINVNVKDGVVLSYGDSFWRGTVPQPMISPVKFERPEVCVADEGDVQGASLCLAVNKLHNRNRGRFIEARGAVLWFLRYAVDSGESMLDIASRYDEYLDRITSTFDTHFVGDHAMQAEYLHNVPYTVSPVKAKLAYAQVPGGNDSTHLALVWKLEVEMEDNFYETAITVYDDHTPLFVIDWVSDSPMPAPDFAPVPKKPSQAPPATYNVFKWGINDPENANRTIEKENFDTLASPLGWHVMPAGNDPRSSNKRYKKGSYSNSTDTWGNNVFAHENWEGRNGWEENYRPSSPDMVFDYPYKPTKTDSSDALAEAKKYINATVTQLFYTANYVHDIFYRYGFDEKSGNFQQHNFGRGGEEGDAVIANAQDGSGYNNANFMTPPDGQNGRCRMYLWNTANPYRDGDLEAGIVIHELAHGLSTRLTGGPANSGCLGWGESGGMGEGWGDFLATTIRSNKNYSDYAMGAWAANREQGIRNYVYSLNETINPSTYKTLDKPGYWGVHAIGEVWAEMLWVVSQRLIEKHGYTDSLYPPAPLEDGTVPEGDFYRPARTDVAGNKKPLVPKHGNSLMVQLVLNGMKLQQCRPSFFDARDAIIQADQILTGGENFCDLWLGFSSRGLGFDAKVEGRTPWGGGIRTNGYKTPLTCRSEEPEEPVPEEPAPEEPEEPKEPEDDGGWWDTIKQAVWNQWKTVPKLLVHEFI
ncbi:hypothetical protein BD410DRAFT_795504 [Rickenella mellea]|uniref:Extracellular metalloproteinase n=1 Tax=Rickenella mellea TaxID=50990 RepID=A0A4Y7PLI3_9AGAM|nr:hypothetical protein BD410DRAFT_795504 [Rickenella mellea]